MQEFLATLPVDPLKLLLWGWLALNAVLLCLLAAVAAVRRDEPAAPPAADPNVQVR